MSKRTASEVEEDTVANVAEVVWGLLTGTQGSQNPDATAAFYNVNGMNEFEKIDHYQKLQRVSKAAAERFASVLGITKVKVYVRPESRDYYEANLPTYKKNMPVTPTMLTELFSGFSYFNTIGSTFVRRVHQSTLYKNRPVFVHIVSVEQGEERDVNWQAWPSGMTNRINEDFSE
jgi:hypothetical protein